MPDSERAPLTFRDEKPAPSLVLDLWAEGKRFMKADRARVLESRDFRRRAGSSVVKIARSWAERHREAAAWARTILPHRVTLERDLTARVGAIQPEYACEPIGFRDTDSERAEAKEAYLNEWRRRSVPTDVFGGKLTEDGQFALLVSPTDVDLDGAPDYFEYIDQAAYQDLSKDEQSGYQKDDDDRRGRYVKSDTDGRKQPKARYEKDDEQARKKHDDDVTDYILRKGCEASAVRVIPALDCVPIFRRGRGSERFELMALVERVLYSPFELVEDGIGWVNKGDRLMVPQAYREDGSSYPAADMGTGGQYYMYTAYLVAQGKGGHDPHPLILSTVAGAGTWDTAGRSGAADDPNSVMRLDLAEEYGITEPLWSYHFGLHTEDDDPDHYARPYIYDLIPIIRGLEGTLTANRAATAVNSYTGHYLTPDAALAAAAPGAVLEQDSQLRRPKIPEPGEIEVAIGEVRPANQAQVGQDAWRLAEYDKGILTEVTAIDSMPGGSGPSGHALLVATTLGTVAKRQIREGIAGAVVAAGEAQLLVLDAIYRRWKIKWPVRTTQEKPVRGTPTASRAPAVFDPDWVLDGQWNLAVEWPEEENLARIDMEANLAERGYGSFDDVQAARGKSDAMSERMKSDKDLLWKLPPVQMMRLQRVTKLAGDREMQKILKLQDQGEMSKGEVPGVGPMPSAARNGAGSGQNIAASVRGGIEGAEQGGAAAAQAAQAAAMSTNGASY
jgi:hypothetical protein